MDIDALWQSSCNWKSQKTGLILVFFRYLFEQGCLWTCGQPGVRKIYRSYSIQTLYLDGSVLSRCAFSSINESMVHKLELAEACPALSRCWPEYGATVQNRLGALERR